MPTMCNGRGPGFRGKGFFMRKRRFNLAPGRASAQTPGMVFYEIDNFFALPRHPGPQDS